MQLATAYMRVAENIPGSVAATVCASGVVTHVHRVRNLIIRVFCYGEGLRNGKCWYARSRCMENRKEAPFSCPMSCSLSQFDSWHRVNKVIFFVVL